MRLILMACVLTLLTGSFTYAQGTPKVVKELLGQTLQAREIESFQLQEYLLRRSPALPKPASADQWSQEADRIRRHLLDDVVFHGWPRSWVDSPPQFEEAGIIDSGNGFRRRKLRYEIVPGFYSTAILYEPENLSGRAPAVLALMGHHSNLGKGIEYEQKLCINLALRGIVTLNLEWIDMGELFDKENDHWFASELNLVGANGVGLFYLAMRRGLDYLAQNPHVDPQRLGATGLSGGGWQTVVLSALDPRIYASVPVAGFNSLPGHVERMQFVAKDGGDLEQEPADFLVGQDYSTFVAMRAPRPTLLINNAEDDCCVRAALVKIKAFDPSIGFFSLYGKSENLQMHENTDPATHNYELDNRQQAYEFFTRSFGLPVAKKEIPVDDQVKSFNDLAVGIPSGNLTMLGLARKFAAAITRPPVPTDAAGRGEWATAERDKLRAVVRHDSVEVREAWAEGNSHDKGIESMWYRFELSDGLSATGDWIKALATPDNAPLSVVIDDQGKKTAGGEIWDRVPWVGGLVDRGQQVLVLDLVFSGDAAPDMPSQFFADMLSAVGKQPLGLETSQLAALSHWAGKQWKPGQLRLETAGIRSQMIGLVTAALEPDLFSDVRTHAGMHSLQYLLDEPVTYQEAPDLFCLDLYKSFDVDRLAAMAEPAQVAMYQTVNVHPLPNPSYEERHAGLAQSNYVRTMGP